MKQAREPWRDLRIGDRVRVVRYPYYLTPDERKRFPELLTLYEHLMQSGQVLTIDEIDQWGQPWANCFSDEMEKSSDNLHSLQLADDCWERVPSE